MNIVIVDGQGCEEVAALAYEAPQNHIGLWYKPWFYKHVESKLERLELSPQSARSSVEFVPVRARADNINPRARARSGYSRLAPKMDLCCGWPGADLGLPDEARPFHVHDDGHSDTVWQRALVPVAARLAPPASGQNNQHIINQHIINQHRAILGANSALIEGNSWVVQSYCLCAFLCVCVSDVVSQVVTHCRDTRGVDPQAGIQTYQTLNTVMFR